jgi:hypothetical protein
MEYRKNGIMECWNNEEKLAKHILNLPNNPLPLSMGEG